MANQTPNLNQQINLQITGTDQMVNAIKNVGRAFDSYAKKLDQVSKKQKQNKKSAKQLSDQGIANIQAGLVQLSTYLLNMNVKINNVFDSMQKGFIKTETAMKLLKSTMGLGGVTDENLLVGFRGAEEKINQLAMGTEFTKEQIAGAFKDMIKDSLTAEQAISVIDKTLAFSTATGGIIDLGEAAKLTTLTFKTLGGDTDRMGDNLNKLYKIAVSSGLGFEDLREALSGVRSGAKSFAETDLREASILTTIAALMEQGESAANAGLKFKNFGNSIVSMYGNITKAQTQFAQTGKVTGKLNMKRLAIHQLTGADVAYKEELDKFVKMQNSGNAALRKQAKADYISLMIARDQYAVEQLFEIDKKTGKRVFKSLDTFGDELVKKFNEIAKGKEGVVGAKKIFKEAFGTEAGSETISALDSFIKKRGKSLKEYAQGINTNLGETTKAQEEMLGTLEKRLELTASAESALSNEIFKHDIYARAGLDTYTEIIKATHKLMENNAGLASSTGMLGRAFQVFTGVGTNVGFALTAMATFSIALTHAKRQAIATGGAVKGLSGTLRAFNTMFLTPALAVTVQMIGGFFVLGVGLIALMKYFSGAKSIGEGFAIILDKIKNSAKAAGGLFNAVFSEQYKGKSIEGVAKGYISKLKEIADVENSLLGLTGQNKKLQEERLVLLKKNLGKEYEVLGKSGVEGITGLQASGSIQTITTVGYAIDTLRKLFNGLAVVAEGMLLPMMFSMNIVMTMLSVTVGLLFSPIRALAYFFGFASEEGNFFNLILKGLGVALGVLVSYFAIVKTYSILSTILQSISGGFLNLKSRVQAAGERLNKINGSIEVNDYNNKGLAHSLNRLKFRYEALTNQLDNYGKKVQDAKNKTYDLKFANESVSAGYDNLSNKVGKFSAGMMAAGGIATTVGVGISSLSESFFGADHWLTKTGNTITVVGGLLLALAPIISLISSLVTYLGISLWVAFGWLIAGLAVVGGVAYLATKLLSSDEEKKPKNKVLKKNKTANSIAKGMSPVATTMPGGSSQSELNQMFGVGTTAVPMSGQSNYARAESYTPQATTKIDKKIDSNFVFNGNIEIKADNPEQLVKEMKKKVNPSFAQSFGSQRG